MIPAVAAFAVVVAMVATATLPWLLGRRVLPWSLAILTILSTSAYLVLGPFLPGRWGLLAYPLFAAAPLTFFLLTVRFLDGHPISSYGFLLPPGSWSRGLGISAALVGIYLLLTLEPGLTLGYLVAPRLSVTSFSIFFLMIPVLVLGQEAVFRGYFLARVSGSFSFVATVFLSAGLYSLSTLDLVAISGASVVEAGTVFFSTVVVGFVVGLVAGFYAYKTNWSLLGPWTFRTGLLWATLLLPVSVAHFSWEYTFLFQLMGLVAALLIVTIFLREPRYRARHYLRESLTPRRRTLLARVRSRRQLAWVAVALVAMGIVAGASGSLSASLEHAPVRILAIASGSMLPTFHIGDAVLMTAVGSPGDVHVGDIVAYNAPYLNPQGPVVHRVIGERMNGSTELFTIKGDANTAPDPRPVTFGQIDGRIVGSAPFVGYLILFPPFGLGLVAFLALLTVYRTSVQGTRRSVRRPVLPVRQVSR